MKASVDELEAGVLATSRPLIARALTLVESTHPQHRADAAELIRRLLPHAGQARRVGISGVPGAGKSTFIDALGTRLIEQGHRVGVLAVDPSSSRTGGSILGDRTRMAALTASDAAFVRPSPSGGHLGGVARATREGMLILEAAGFDVIVVETVGVGQSEVAVSGMVDTFLLLTLARSGDQLQGIKRGILELADVIAVNKADGEHAGDARVAARELAIAMKLISSDPDAPRPQVLTCSALTGDRLDGVWEAICRHSDALREGGILDARRRDQQVAWMWTLVEEELRLALRNSSDIEAVRDDVERRVGNGEIAAGQGARRIVGLLLGESASNPPTP